MKPLVSESTGGGWLWAAWQTYLHDPIALQAACLHMGLSLVRNFDTMIENLQNESDLPSESTARYGLNGITRRGARTVRNAAHVMQQECGKLNLTFATMTIPDLPAKQMAALHENWSRVVELYRLSIRRLLRRQGLSGEIVSASEVQEARYETTGIPVLHLHSVFQGRQPYHGWAMSPSDHDRIVRQTITTVVGEVKESFKSAGKLERVTSNAGGYLGKYMSKGTAVVRKLRADGFTGWMPHQWWNCTRSLSRRVEQQTIRADEFADFLLSATVGQGGDVWAYHGTVNIDIGAHEPYWLATYGRLRPAFLERLRGYICNLNLV